MRAILSLALLAALVLAGCTSSSSDESTSASTSATGKATTPSSGTKTESSSSTATGASASPTTAPAANRAPIIAAFSANVTGGAAPLTVGFSPNATDADEDALTFTLSFGDGSANATGRLPSANLTHIFTVAGNHTVRLVVSDGKAVANKTLQVQATAGASAPPPSIVFEGSVVLPDPFLLSLDSCISALIDGGEVGVFGGVHQLPSDVEAAWSFAVTPASGWATFSSADGGTIAGNGNSGTVGEGVSMVIVCASEPMVDYTLTLMAP